MKNSTKTGKKWGKQQETKSDKRQKMVAVKRLKPNSSQDDKLHFKKSRTKTMNKLHINVHPLFAYIKA